MFIVNELCPYVVAFAGVGFTKSMFGVFSLTARVKYSPSLRLTVVTFILCPELERPSVWALLHH